MKGLLTLTVALTIGAGCTKQTGSAVKNQTQDARTPQSLLIQAASPEPAKEAEKDVPPEFKHVDFKNLSFPVAKREIVRLKNGEYEYRQGMGALSYGIDDVNYADLNEDGREEAIVHLFQLICGASCDGGTDIFYFYSLKRGRLSLLTRLEIGSFAYDCGLKTFSLKKETLFLETFRSCRFTGSAFSPVHSDPDERGGKLSTNRYTQFDLQFNGSRFVQRKRKVFSYPDVYDFRGHERKIEINND